MSLDNAPNWTDIAQVGIGVAGLIGLAVTSVLAYRAAKAAMGATIAADKTLKAQNRPRIRVGYIAAELPSKGKSSLTVTIDIVNIGGYTARIIASHCNVWVAEKLPMVRPYQSSHHSKVDPFPVFPQIDLTPGNSTDKKVQLPISAVQTADFCERNSALFVMGYIQYQDAEGSPRRTMFCRKYDALSGRFIPTEDRDYEVEN